MQKPTVCHWADCDGCEPRVPAGDPSAARRWAQAALADPAAGHALRARVAALPGIALANSTDHHLAEQLIHAIVLGTLRVCAGSGPRRTLMRLAVQAAPAPAPAASSAPAARRSAPAPAPVAAEPPIDAPAMAQALREASVSGVPFCEECVRAAATA